MKVGSQDETYFLLLPITPFLSSSDTFPKQYTEKNGRRKEARKEKKEKKA
jgi:hypothetical protein